MMTMKIDRATLLASIALTISVVSLGLNLLPRSLVPSLTQSPHTWREIASFSGTENTTTQAFYVPSYLWRINWNVTWKDLTEDGRFSTYIYSPGVVEKWENALTGFGGYLFKVGPGGSKSNGIETFYGIGNEDLYFKIVITNVEFWKIKVEAWI